MILSIARRDVITARPSDHIEDVTGLMSYYNVGGVVVLHEQRPIGIITDRDVALRIFPLLAEGRSLSELTAEELMTRNLKTIHEDKGFDIALEIMKSADIRRLPVVDHTGRLRGLVALDDVLRAISRSLDFAVDVIDRQWRGARSDLRARKMPQPVTVTPI